MKAQDIGRETFLPIRSRFQPYAGYWEFCCAFTFLWVQGYAVFLSANWSTATFIFNYSIIALAGSIGLGWKLLKKTRFHRASEVDLISHLYFFDVLTEHYRHEREAAPQNLKDNILAKIFLAKSRQSIVQWQRRSFKLLDYHLLRDRPSYINQAPIISFTTLETLSGWLTVGACPLLKLCAVTSLSLDALTASIMPRWNWGGIIWSCSHTI